MATQGLKSLTIHSGNGPAQESKIMVSEANRFFQRLVGLLGRRSMKDTEALLITPCSGIHTFGMRIPIDVIFLSRENKVLGMADNVFPNRFRMAPKGTFKVMEIAQGNRIRTGINLDDYLIFV